ncbi:MAG: tyrosine-type recombinase/integrase [Chloroflexota bacterium]
MSRTLDRPVIAPTQTQALTLSRPFSPHRDPAAVYLATLGQGSRRTMRASLNKVARLLGLEPIERQGREVTYRHCHWAQVRRSHLVAVRSRLTLRYAPATVNKHLSAIRGTLRQAHRLGQMDSQDYQRALTVESVSAEPEPAGRLLTAEEIGDLLHHCIQDPSPAGARDAAMIALWAVAGPRRAEIVNLDLGDYDRRTGAVRIRSGRAQTGRTVYVANGAQRAMNDWIAVRGSDWGPLFVPIHHTGKLRIARMTPQAAYTILRKRSEQAGVERVSPHDLRRTALSNLIDKTDLGTAQQIAGHADPKTTARYDCRGERAKREAAAAMTLTCPGWK